MSSKKTIKKFIGNPWFIGIGTYIIADLILRLIFDFKLFEYIALFIINIIKWIGKLLDSKLSISVWLFILTVFAIPLIVRIIALLIPKKTKEILIPYNEYNKDTFDGLVWRWYWKFNKYGKKYEIQNLSVFCPNCDCQLTSSYGALKCPNCEFRKHEGTKSTQDIELLIFHHVRKKHFPDF